MDSKVFKILNFLDAHSVGENVNISPILDELFPVRNTRDQNELLSVWPNIQGLLNTMKKEGFIECQTMSHLIKGNLTDGYAWFHNTPVYMQITSEGKEVLYHEQNKSREEKLSDSIIETNASTIDNNKASISNFKFQKTAQKWSIVLAGISVAFIIVSVIQTCNNDNSKNFNGIKEQLKQNKIAQDSIHNSLERIDQTLKSFSADTSHK
jgi:hypothetical protein